MNNEKELKSKGVHQIYLDLDKRIVTSATGKRMASLGMKRVGCYSMVCDDKSFKVVLPLYGSEDKAGKKSVIMFHALNPQLVAHAISKSSAFGDVVDTSSEKRKLVDTVGSMDFSDGFDIQNILGTFLPLMSGGGGFTIKATFSFDDFVISDGDFEDMALETSDKFEDLEVGASVISQKLLTDPKISKLLTGSMFGKVATLKNKAKSEFF